MAQANPFLKDELRKKQRASQQKKLHVTSRDEFLAIVSHDLKNPIASIRTAADLLAQFQLSPDIQHLVDLIQRNAETSFRLIGDLLDMESLSLGTLRLQPGLHKIDELIRTAVAAAQRLADEKDIKLEYHPVDVEVSCDSERILQVLNNLLANAIKFSPEHSRVQIQIEKAADQVQISVTDHGPGIEERQSPLGLFFAKMLVEAHGGNLGEMSEPGVHTRFYVSLPIN